MLGTTAEICAKLPSASVQLTAGGVASTLPAASVALTLKNQLPDDKES